MSLPNYIQKTLGMKPEVNKIYDDLDEWLDYCRMELINFDPRDLYKSKEYKTWSKERDKKDRKSSRVKKSEVR